MNGGGGMAGGANLVHKFADLSLSSSNNGPPNSNFTHTNNNNNNNNDGLFQVMKAVEAAEAAIRQQAEENAILRTERTELQRKIQELEKYVRCNIISRKMYSLFKFHEVQL